MAVGVAVVAVGLFQLVPAGAQTAGGVAVRGPAGAAGVGTSRRQRCRAAPGGGRRPARQGSRGAFCQQPYRRTIGEFLCGCRPLSNDQFKKYPKHKFIDPGRPDEFVQFQRSPGG